MSRRIKAQKREIREAIAEGQAVMDVTDTWFLHEAKRQRRNLVQIKKSRHMEESEPIFCDDIDALTLSFMLAVNNSSGRKAVH